MSEPTATGRGTTLALAVIVIILILLAASWWLSSSQDTSEEVLTIPEPVVPAVPAPAPRPVPVPEPEPEPESEPEPAPESEPEPEPEPELPSLNESDAYLSEQLEPLLNSEQLQLIVNDELARKVVRAVMGAAEHRLVNQYRPVLSPLPNLEVEQVKAAPEAEFRLKASNYQRYDAHLALLDSVKPATLANLYQQLEPLLEEAYAEQGLEGGFRQVVLQAIEVFLDTPEVEGPLRLTRPAVMYKYLDPRLERLPDPQKLLLRMGPERAGKVKQYLRDLKQALE